MLQQKPRPNRPAVDFALKVTSDGELWAMRVVFDVDLDALALRAWSEPLRVVEESIRWLAENGRYERRLRAAILRAWLELWKSPDAEFHAAAVRGIPKLLEFYTRESLSEFLRTQDFSMHEIAGLLIP